MDLDELAKHLTIKGTCMTVEKSYFRLTQAPDPSEVRPEPVLMEALKMLESKWNGKRADYKYIDDQFRSMRQDLTVQRIQNDFCVKVSPVVPSSQGPYRSSPRLPLRHLLTLLLPCLCAGL